MLHIEEMRSQSTGTESPPNVRLPTPELYVVLSTPMNRPLIPCRTGRTCMSRGRRKAHTSPPYTARVSAYGPALRGK
jgi:hypothetical protein